MKRKIIIMVILIGLLLIFTSCQKIPKTVTPRYTAAADIAGIELLRDASSDGVSGWQVLHTLSAEETPDFLAALCSLSIDWNWSPIGHWGDLCVRISYTTGEQELFGSGAFEYLSSTGESEYEWRHSIRYDDLYSLFSNYVSAEELPSF